MFSPHSIDGPNVWHGRALSREQLTSLLSRAAATPTLANLAACADAHAQRLASEAVRDRVAVAGLRRRMVGQSRRIR